jgi:hypothetical protein
LLEEGEDKTKRMIALREKLLNGNPELLNRKLNLAGLRINLNFK